MDDVFVELAALVSSGPPSLEALAALNATYGMRVDPVGTAQIATEYHLVTAPGMA